MDQDGAAIDILVQSRRNRRAAERFFRQLLKGQESVPFVLVTDNLKSYSAAIRTVIPSVSHDAERYANNRAEVIRLHCNESLRALAFRHTKDLEIAGKRVSGAGQ